MVLVTHLFRLVLHCLQLLVLLLANHCKLLLQVHFLSCHKLQLCFQLSKSVQILSCIVMLILDALLVPIYLLEQFLDLTVFFSHRLFIHLGILFHFDHTDFELVALSFQIVHLFGHSCFEANSVHERGSLKVLTRRSNFTELDVCSLDKPLHVFS